MKVQRRRLKREVKMVIATIAAATIFISGYKGLTEPIMEVTQDVVYETSFKVKALIIDKQIKPVEENLQISGSISAPIEMEPERKFYVSVLFGGDVYNVEVSEAYYLGSAVHDNIEAHYSKEYGDIVVDARMVNED